MQHAAARCEVLVGRKPNDLREARIKDLPTGQWPLGVVCCERRQRIVTERREQSRVCCGYLQQPNHERPLVLHVAARKLA